MITVIEADDEMLCVPRRFVRDVAAWETSIHPHHFVDQLSFDIVVAYMPALVLV